jgi:hypothetical protein
MKRVPQQTRPMGGGKMYWWKFLGDQALSELIVSPARYLEITTRLYPESEMSGRPGVLYSPQPGEKLKQRIPGRIQDEPAEIVVGEAWRVTPPEFEGSESELVEEELAVAD